MKNKIKLIELCGSRDNLINEMAGMESKIENLDFYYHSLESFYEYKKEMEILLKEIEAIMLRVDELKKEIIKFSGE
jgi:archaellum component FlaC